MPPFGAPLFREGCWRQPSTHITELFPTTELYSALDQFPTMTLNFISRLAFVTSGEDWVQEGVKRVNLGLAGRFVAGSELRVPPWFWEK